jgi:dynein heavy chain
LDQVIWT